MDRSLELNRIASELAPDDQACAWNWGIAATAQGRWDEADRAWARCGITVPPDPKPFDWSLGAVPIRLSIGEVVWCKRLDPARAQIDNIPYPSSGHRMGDIMLHDGAPTGARQLNGREVPVFDALALLVRSDLETAIARITVGDDPALEALQQLSIAEGVPFEDWTSSVRILCRECSEGNPDGADAPHAHREEQDASTRALGIALRSGSSAGSLLQAWAREGVGRSWVLDVSEP